MKELKFPSYEWLKALPLKRTCMRKDSISGKLYKDEEHCEYKFTLFDTPVYVYGQLSYNEDDSRYIYFDVMENGYSNMNSYGLGLKFNKKIIRNSVNMHRKYTRCFIENLMQIGLGNGTVHQKNVLNVIFGKQKKGLSGEV